ncbi:PH domain-containing protein [Gallaecimonas pentaromativorans]|uniref:PH domain-containing protein n=1 Tax=Gallaecimonas pentaromativorans TaxID=584787 RepID=UPI003A93809B
MYHNHVVETLPEARQLPWQQVAPRYPAMEGYRMLLIVLAVLVAAAAAPLLAGDSAMALLTLPLAVLVVILVGWHRVELAKRFRYVVREQDIHSAEGIFWQKHTALSYSRIQHIAIEQGPWERRFGLARLRLFSAGSSSAELELPGLEEAQAQQLRQWLLERIGPQ